MQSLARYLPHRLNSTVLNLSITSTFIFIIIVSQYKICFSITNEFYFLDHRHLFLFDTAKNEEKMRHRNFRVAFLDIGKDGWFISMNQNLLDYLCFCKAQLGKMLKNYLIVRLLR